MGSSFPSDFSRWLLHHQTGMFLWIHHKKPPALLHKADTLLEHRPDEARLDRDHRRLGLASLVPSLLNMAIEIVDLPIEHGDFP